MYLQNFTGNGSIISDYQAPDDALDGAIVHLAWYGYGSYCGKSLVIFEKDGQLYEVNGSHCSCNGLERQWEPETTCWEALDKRDFSGEYDGGQEATDALQTLVNKHLRRI